MVNTGRHCMVLLALLLCGAGAKAQQTQTDTRSDRLPGVGIKTNLLYDATATFNLGVEFRTGSKTSLDLSGNWNPFTFGDNRKWKHALIQPEFRLWTKETFAGHFFGLHAHYAYYNVGNLPNGPFSEYMAAHRFEGWAAGAGVSYGYRWNFSRNWGLEATVGVGYAYLDYDRYACGECGKKLGSETKNYFGPTKAGITLIYSFGGRKKPAPAPVPVYVPVVVQPEPEPVPVIIYDPQLAVSYLTPEAEAVKQRSDAGRAFLDFAVGRSEIVPAFKNNDAELHKIYELVDAVMADTNATITGITITGYASPEGTYASNLTLSERRANALKNHLVNKYGFPAALFTVSGGGEDWATLDTLVSRSNMPEKASILGIIRGTDIFDGRERKLMQLAGGAPYRAMKTDLFPQLRRSEVEVHYTVLPFTVEQGKEVFRTNPGNLSLNEMFLIANTYAPGSDAFNEVFETAARIFPTDDTANLNAAASALARKDALSAERYLNRIAERSAAYWNNTGALLFLRGETNAAADCFRKAAEAGDTEAAVNAAELRKHRESLPNE